MKDDLEKLKLEGLEAMTSKQVDDMERNYSIAEARHAKVKDASDLVKKQLMDLQAGVEHLHGKLSEIKLEGSETSSTKVNNITTIN